MIISDQPERENVPEQTSYKPVEEAEPEIVTTHADNSEWRKYTETY